MFSNFPRTTGALALVLLICVVFSFAQESSGVNSGYSSAVSSNRTYDQWTWHNAPLRAVLSDELAKIGGVDIVISDEITGELSLNVTKKTWREVLGIICKLKKITVINNEKYLLLLTDNEYQAQQMNSASSAAAVDQIQPLRREIIHCSNINAAEMSKSVGTLLSSRGKITVVDHANALLIFDSDENINQIKNMINKLDIEVEQINISAKILEVSSGNGQNLGIHWGYFQANGTPTVVAKDPNRDSTTSASATHLVNSLLDRLTYGIMGKDKFAIALDYLFSVSKAEVVAQPNITTLDNKTARIFMGSQVQVNTKDQAFNTIATFKEAGTELIVKPHVTDGKRIMLDIMAKKESPDGNNISTQTASTQVVVNNGETVVIAGLTSNIKTDKENGIPILKDIPLLGNLFKSSSKVNEKKDLLIFVTPNIIQKDIDRASQAKDSIQAN